ncbi:NF038130 family PEP-CTERM protein [Trichocoleus sp. FACHB-90]|uniref:NF038130 family PEP-CTERM protein n=2 Tax=Cyanophyceae TaxID=3028117 RepID=UPI0019A7AACC|nr:NF038130 family PEP-CTERM protein [Trichocoleus sp. FACHB-90]MBD1927582.1 NF038130 family PEP-CTERM protein [Trichocoleus sp. FACHB-90]
MLIGSSKKLNNQELSKQTRMLKAIEKLLISASVVGVSAIASNPAFATTLKPSNIQFSTYQDKPQVQTYLFGDTQYKTVNGIERQLLNDITRDDINKATQALTDDSAATNVEFWYGSENPQRVGFTANLGKNTVKVETVVQEDWQDEKLAKGWLDGFLGAYGSLLPASPTADQYNLMLDTLKTKGLYSAGDPNVGAVALDDQTGKLQIDLVGHLDRAGLYIDTRQTIPNPIKTIRQNGKTIPNPTFGQPIPNPNYLKPKNDARYATGNIFLDQAIVALATKSVQQGKFFQMSEIAKVTFNGVVDYAFGFSAIDSGAFAADASVSDTTSHTAIYSWNRTYQLPPSESVPEPSAMLGLISVGGFLVGKRKMLKKA